MFAGNLLWHCEGLCAGCSPWRRTKPRRYGPFPYVLKGIEGEVGRGGLENIPPVYSKLRASAGRTQMDAGSEINADLGNRGENTLILNCWIDWELLKIVYRVTDIYTNKHTHTQNKSNRHTNNSLEKFGSEIHLIWKSLHIPSFDRFSSVVQCFSTTVR